MAQVLSQLKVPEHPDLLVGSSTGDDAAVYRISDSQALVVTLDFFPPIVDDPWFYGAISAANAISDVYAMGGKPFLALNIVCFPENLPTSILSEIQKGGQDKADEAGVIIVGGHTIKDEEPKYGMAVLGFIEPGKQVRNTGARLGDKLILTKPIGTGLITTASKRDLVSPGILSGALESMLRLNREASEAMVKVGVNACTDISGFGLLGHLKRMLIGSGMSATVDFSQVPLLEGTWSLADQGIFPGGTESNIEYVNAVVSWDYSLSVASKFILCDPQTSGGLLISVHSSKSEELLADLRLSGNSEATVIGEVSSEKAVGQLIQVVK